MSDGCLRECKKRMLDGQPRTCPYTIAAPSAPKGPSEQDYSDNDGIRFAAARFVDDDVVEKTMHGNGFI